MNFLSFHFFHILIVEYHPHFLPKHLGLSIFLPLPLCRRGGAARAARCARCRVMSCQCVCCLRVFRPAISTPAHPMVAAIAPRPRRSVIAPAPVPAFFFLLLARADLPASAGDQPDGRHSGSRFQVVQHSTGFVDYRTFHQQITEPGVVMA